MNAKNAKAQRMAPLKTPTVGGGTIRSVGHIGRLQRILDNDADYVSPLDMLAELRDDNMQLVAHMRALHDVCDAPGR